MTSQYSFFFPPDFIITQLHEILLVDRTEGRDSMSEKVLGILSGNRSVFSILPYVSEFLLLTPDRVIVTRQSAKLPFYASTTHTDVGDILAELLKTVKAEEILKSGKHNFAISNSEITKVELKECRWSHPQWACVDLNIHTAEGNISGISWAFQRKKTQDLKTARIYCEKFLEMRGIKTEGEDLLDGVKVA